ncbi:MAG: DJ-1/PfpI family protein [Endomicrobiia bacterium]
MKLLNFLLIVFLLCNNIFGEIPEKKKTKPKAKGVKQMELKGKKVVMIIASQNFRDEEYLEPKRILSSAGAEIITASSSLSTATGMLGAKVKPDILISDIKPEDYDAIIFVGGIGSSEYWENQTAHNIARKAIEKNKIVAAICIAPVTLANSGLLKGKKATAFPSVKGQISSKGAKYTGVPVEQDEKIITGIGPESATQFGEVIKKALMSK